MSQNGCILVNANFSFAIMYETSNLRFVLCFDRSWSRCGQLAHIYLSQTDVFTSLLYSANHLSVVPLLTPRFAGGTQDEDAFAQTWLPLNLNFDRTHAMIGQKLSVYRTLIRALIFSTDLHLNQAYSGETLQHLCTHFLCWEFAHGAFYFFMLYPECCPCNPLLCSM